MPAVYRSLQAFAKKLHRSLWFAVTGGDPILHPDFWSLLELIKDRSHRAVVMGNPFHLTEENCVSLGEMLDSFMGSQTDECVLSLNILLPDPETRISFSGCTMTMENERGSWDYELRNPVEADSDCYGYDDYVVLKKESGTLVIIST